MNKLIFGIPLLLVFLIPFANAEVTIVPAVGSGAPGCEETVDGCYLPSVVNVDVGESVIFSNTDSAAHTFTSGTPDAGPDGIFDTSLLMVDNSYEFVPISEGTIDYLCMVHPWMVGQIIVGQGNENPIPDPTPQPMEDDPLVVENERLRDEVRDLKLENKDLKNTINQLQDEIDSLNDRIIVMTTEFTNEIIQINQWFREHLALLG